MSDEDPFLTLGKVIAIPVHAITNMAVGLALRGQISIPRLRLICDDLDSTQEPPKKIRSRRYTAFVVARRKHRRKGAR